MHGILFFFFVRLCSIDMHHKTILIFVVVLNLAHFELLDFGSFIVQLEA